MHSISKAYHSVTVFIWANTFAPGEVLFHGLVIIMWMSICRVKLRRLLQESNLYRPQLLLGKIKDTNLYAECAILYGKVVTGWHIELTHCLSLQ